MGTIGFPATNVYHPHLNSESGPTCRWLPYSYRLVAIGVLCITIMSCQANRIRMELSQMHLLKRMRLVRLMPQANRVRALHYLA